MDMTMELYNAAKSSVKKNLFIVPGGDHNDTFLRAGHDYHMKLRAFMCECLGEEIPPEPQRVQEGQYSVQEQEQREREQREGAELLDGGKRDAQ